MDRGNMHPPPEYAEDQSDTDLNAMLVAAEDRLLAAIQTGLDLDAGLAEIIGKAPRPGTSAGDCSSASVDPGEHSIRVDESSPEDRYLAGPGRAVYLNAITMQARKAAAAAKVQAARHAAERAGRRGEERKGHHAKGSRCGAARLIIPILLLARALRVSWKRRRYSAAAAYLARAGRSETIAVTRLQQDFLDFLLKTEGLPYGLARLRAEAIVETVEAGDDVPAVDERPGTNDGQRRGRALVTLAVVSVAASLVTAATTGFLLSHRAHEPGQRASLGTVAAGILGLGPGQQAQAPTVIEFAPGQAQLNDPAKSVLRSLARQITADLATLGIAGFADPAGGVIADRGLSLERAQSVAAFLEARGVPSSDIQLLGVVSRDAVNATPQEPGGVIISVGMPGP
jgi:outer membrane protein OmpA-like peptidoglycan-associated protein